MTEFGTPNEILPAPDGERNVAYNAAVIQSLTDEVIGGAERERLGKILWARVLVNELVQRIANLRALHKLARAEGYVAGLEAAAKFHEKYAAKAEHKAKGSGILVQKMSWHNWSAKAIRALGKEEE